MAKNQTVQIEGLTELRRDLKAIDKKLPRELTKAQRKALESTAKKAAALAPKRTGKLAASIRPFATAKTAGLRSRLPYAAVIHWGSRSSNPAEIKGRPFASKAVEADLDRVVEAMGDAVDDLARRHGFR